MSRPLTRRNFLRLGAASAASAVLVGCQAPRAWVTLEPYVHPPEEQVAGNPTWYASTCRQCPAGCGIIVRVMNGRALKIEGNPEHPLNQGKLCARGQASLQLLYHPDRLQSPVQQAKRGARDYKPIVWNEAANTLSVKLQGAGANLAVWCGSGISGHLYDILQRLTKALGAPAPVLFDADVAFGGYQALRNADQTLFGSNALPIYDMSRADVVLSFGADLFGPWLSDVRHAIAYGAFRSQPLGMRGYMVQLEPRMSMAGSRADRWYAIRPGSEGLIAQAIARLIADQNLGPADRVARAKSVAGSIDLNAAAAASDVSVDDLTSLARLFATAQHPLAVPGASLSGLDKGVDATTIVQALNLIAGNVGQPGGLILSQPSPHPAVVEPAVSGYSDVQKLLDRIRGGQVQALLVVGANPAYDLPAKAGFADAVAKVPFVASFSPIVDETAVAADLILPDRTPLESWGYALASPNYLMPAVGSLQPVVTPLYDVRSAADVLLTVASTIPAAAQALPYSDEVTMLQSVIGNLRPGAAGGSGPDVLWARFLQHGGWWPATTPAPVAATGQPKAISISPTTFQGSEQDFPYILNLYPTVLVGASRGAALPWLQGSPEPMTSIAWQTWVQIHPDTAAKLGVDNNDIVRVTSPMGEIEAPVYVYPGLRPDTVSIPLGQGHTDLGRYASGFGVNPLQLLGATAEASGISLQWANVRVKLAKTGKQDILATFEYTPGVREGFPNRGVPGE